MTRIGRRKCPTVVSRETIIGHQGARKKTPSPAKLLVAGLLFLLGRFFVIGNVVFLAPVTGDGAVSLIAVVVPGVF